MKWREAISRGAKKAILCDREEKAIEVIHKNIEKTHTNDHIQLYKMDYEEVLKTKINEKLDIVFIDPPYQTDYAYLAVKQIIENQLIDENSILVIETDQVEKLKSQLQNLRIEITDERKYGRVHLLFLALKRKGVNHGNIYNIRNIRGIVRDK